MNRIIHCWNKNWPEIWCGLTGGLPPFLLAASPAPLGGAIPVFHYHVVDAEEFEQDLEFLNTNGYSTATADELLEVLLYGKSSTERRVVLSIDDGAFNLHNVAYPLLEAYSCRAVAFIAPGLHSEAADECAERLCTWHEIEQMHKSGVIDFQSHTLEHRYVPRWPQPWPVTGVEASLVDVMRDTPRPLEEDFQRAKAVIEQRLCKRVRHLAMPNYRTTPRATAIAKRVGYEGIWLGVLPRKPWNRPGDSPEQIVRLSGEFVRRLPGRGRRSVGDILRTRHASNLRRMLRSKSTIGAEA